MTAFPIGDADPAWVELTGTMRVRVAGGLVQLQVSKDNGNGTYDVATVILEGSLRDVRKASTTVWPSYNSQGYPTNFVTAGQLLQREVDQANSRGEVAAPDGPPVKGSSVGH